MFLLFSQQPVDSQNLGFIDPKAQSVQVSVSGRDFTVHQSPALLSSQREGGTTGAGMRLPNRHYGPVCRRHSTPSFEEGRLVRIMASVKILTCTTVLWKITPIFAEFISSPSNLFFTSGVLSPSSSVLELGCGISPLTGLALGPHVAHYLLTDQSYVQRLVNQNIDENTQPLTSTKKGGDSHKGRSKAKPKGKPSTNTTRTTSTVKFETLDWETDSVTAGLSPTGDFDMVVACDCVYNEALVRPLVSTCVDACSLRDADEGGGEGEEGTPTICVVAQQLRSDEVFEAWLVEFHRYFHVWRLPDEILPRPLRSDVGFVIHAGILRKSQ